MNKGLNRGRKFCGGWSRKNLRPIALVAAEIWIVIAVVLLLGMRPVWTFIHRPAHLNETAAECGSVGTFYGLPTMDRVGTRMAYVQTTENGVGIFLRDNTTGKTQSVQEYQERDTPVFASRFSMLPWSPDDASFAYTRNVSKGNVITEKQEIVICHVGRGKTESIPCEVVTELAWWPTANSFFSWLTSDAFVYVGRRQELHLVQKHADEQWKDTVRLVASQSTNVPTYITAISSNDIVWQQGQSLWHFNLNSSNAPVEFYQTSTNDFALASVTPVSYSPETGQILLSCLGKEDESLWQLTPGSSPSKKPRQINSARSIRESKWINGGKGYAYVCQMKKNRILVVQPDAASKPFSLFLNGDVMSFTTSPNGKRLFIWGVTSNELARSLWEYDIGLGSLKCVAAGSDKPLQFAKNIALLRGTMTSPSRQAIKLRLYLPADFDRRQQRRYPLVIGGPYLINYGPAFANCGIIYASVTRNGVDNETMNKWEGETWEYHDYLAEMPFVDSGRVFLGMSSAETSALDNFISKHPNAWQGVILLNPSKLPDVEGLVSGSHALRILISAGTLEGEENTRKIRTFQETALKNGVKVEVYIQPDAGHNFTSKSPMTERMLEIMHFVLADQMP